MKNKISKIVKPVVSLLCIIWLLIFSSCSDDPVNTKQNTGGTNTTPIGWPNGIPVTASIGPAGGNINSVDSSFELIIPPGALSSITDITVQPIENFCFNGHDDAFRLTPSGQQFAQPVTIKFHYSAEVLQSTYNILMGIARQDVSGHWHYFNNINNDTVNRVISTNITQFGFSGDDNTDNGDFSFFDIAHLDPHYTHANLNQVVNMAVTYVAVPGGSGGDELYYLPKPIDSWYVNGVRNGNTVLGTITNMQGQTSNYKAPAQVPSPNYVHVQALVNTGINYRGQVISTSMLQSTIVIVSDSMVFDLKIDMNWPNYQYGIIEYMCNYTDGADMVVTVRGGGIGYSNVSITNIVNRMPNVVPPSGHYPNGQGSITWIPGNDSGHINISDVAAIIIPNGNVLSIGFGHTNIKYALFHCVPPQGDPYDIGGYAAPSALNGLSFRSVDSTQIVTINPFWITATLTPRH